MDADLVEALIEHGNWLREVAPAKAIQAYAAGLLELADQVAASPAGPLPGDLRARLRSLLPGIYRAQGEDLARPVDNAAYHARLSRLSAAIERAAPKP